MRRRTFIRNTFLAGLPAVSIAACGSKAQRVKPTLRVLTWDDYFDPQVLTTFENEHDCQIEVSTFSSNESLLDRLVSGETADIVVPTSYMRRILGKEGLTEPFQLVSGIKVEAIPFLRGISGLAWTTDTPHQQPCSWEWLSMENVGSITLLDDMRETIGAALKYLGHSANSTDEQQLMAAKDLVQEWKQRIAAFESEYYKHGLVAGEYSLVHGYSGDIFAACTRNPQIRFAVPKEGALFSTDELCVTSGSRQKELATAFVNAQASPEVLAAHAAYTGYQAANITDGILVPQGLDPIPAEALQRSEEIEHLGEAHDLWVRLWEEIRRD
jgi:spermidine/putrescine transport system substrate-binding protein